MKIGRMAVIAAVLFISSTVAVELRRHSESGRWVGYGWLSDTFGADKTPVRYWYKAAVVSVHDTLLFHYYELVASFDPDCILTFREFRNPFNPLSIGKDATAKVAMRSGVIYLVDKRGRLHKGQLVMQALMAKRLP